MAVLALPVVLLAFAIAVWSVGARMPGGTGTLLQGLAMLVAVLAALVILSFVLIVATLGSVHL